MILNLTQKLIDTNLKQYVNGRRTELVSDERSGLYIELRNTSKGEGTFYLRLKDSTNKTCHQKLGRTNEISLADARAKVIEFRAAMANGTDAKSLQVLKKGEMTLGALWTEYLDFAKSTKRSWVRDRQLFEIRIAPRFSHLKLCEITVRQIQTLMMDIRKEGLSGASADHHGQLMRRMGNLAVKWGYLDVNFARGIQLYHDFNQVNNIPTDEQLQKLIEVLNTDSNRPICLLALWLLSTGARLNEALKMQHKHIDLQTRIWTVPQETSKSKRPRYIPLNDSALEVLKKIERKEKDIYVFTNPKTQKHFVSVFKPWNRIRNAAFLPKLRLHDLRHMYATFCINSGCSLTEISRNLGHADSRMTELRYAHVNTTTMLRTANSVSNKLSMVMRPKLVVDNSQEAA